MKIEIKNFEELSKIELYEILKVRAKVFVVEQNCIYNDLDNKDIYSYHLILKEDSIMVAYLRLYEKSEDEISFGRVLVTSEGRGKGYAKKIVNEAISFIERTWENKSIVIEAQSYLQKFYKEFGFMAFSEEFLEDGIPHILMKRSRL